MPYFIDEATDDPAARSQRSSLDRLEFASARPLDPEPALPNACMHGTVGAGGCTWLNGAN
jgi:hypothetical protein